MTVIYLPQLRVAFTSRYAFGKFALLSWYPWQTIHAPRRLSTLFLMLIMNSHYLVDCHFFASFCLDYSRAPIHDIHRIPYSQRDASWVGIAIRISTFWPTTMLCSSFRGHRHLNLFKYQYKTSQARIKIQVSSQETLDFTCTILRQVAWPALCIIMAACSWHKMIEFDSTLVLPWERRSALELPFNGVQAVCVRQHYPYYANPLRG